MIALFSNLAHGWHAACIAASAFGAMVAGDGHRSSRDRKEEYGMTSKWVRAFYTAVLGTALSAAGGAVYAQQGGREIVLGAVVPSSGPFAEWGRANTTTLQMLEKQVNAAGGINGA